MPEPNLPKNYIHYDPERVDYSLTGEELEKIKYASQNNWKDFFICCVSIGLPCLINAIVEINKQDKFTPTLSFNINLLLGIVGVVLGVAFYIAWQKTKCSVDEIIKKIKEKPKLEYQPKVNNVGSIAPLDELEIIQHLTGEKSTNSTLPPDSAPTRTP